MLTRLCNSRKAGSEIFSKYFYGLKSGKDIDGYWSGFDSK
jgi:hypothetical protein